MREAASLWLASLVGVRIDIPTVGPSAILTLEPHRENPETLLWLSTVTEVTGGRSEFTPVNLGSSDFPSRKL